MANRSVFVVSLDNKFCIRENTDFEFFSGFSDKQKKRCICSLHKEYLKANNGKKVLEISSKSEDKLGVDLSAFNLMFKTKSGKEVSVESAFQAGKVFENGGPYTDLLDVSSKAAKKDERLKSSGRIISFCFDGIEFETEPKTYFYNWLYINALHLHESYTEHMLGYDAFTDIEFNPQKSINCQAEAAAVYVSLRKQGLLEEALKNKDSFKEIVYMQNMWVNKYLERSFL